MPIILQAWLTLLSCLASSSSPTLARVIFCSVVTVVLQCGHCGPRWVSFLQAGRGPKVERALRLRRADIPPALSADASTRPMKGLGRAVISAGYLGNSARQEA